MKLTTKKQLMARYTILFAIISLIVFYLFYKNGVTFIWGSKGTGWIITTHQRADVLGRIYPQFLL